ncbi:MAG: DUF642 domain-containing protein [Phycisphaeraceae bacterium]|nr:MAG: DUF642 domain-containing protein [Phycisphaeraceae bacterium]
MRLLAITVLSGCCCALSAQASINLVVNGSFELGDYNNTDADPRPNYMIVSTGMTNITGWSVVGDKGVHWQLLPPGTTTDGIYAVDLIGENPPGLFPTLSQSIPTVPGLTYELSFDAFAGDLPNVAHVSIGTLVNQHFTGGWPGTLEPASFDRLTYIFVATGPVSTLEFQVLDSDGYGPVIDNVSIVLVPTPASPALVALGLGIGMRRRRGLAEN